MRISVFILCWIIPGCLLVSCRAPLPEARSEPDPTEWNVQEVRAHLAFLDGADTEGRRTASRGFARAATYIADQLRRAGWQPILDGEYRLQYADRTTVSIPRSVYRINDDTLRFAHGVDYLITEPIGLDTLITSGEVPNVPGMLFASILEGQTEIPSEWRILIEQESTISTGPMHVIAMLPGAHPRHRDSLDVILAPLDGLGPHGDALWTTGADHAIASAALLALAGRRSAIQRRWALWPRTTMIVFASGTIGECTGPEKLVRHFPWNRESVSSFTVLTSGALRCDWGAAAGSLGMQPTIMGWAPVELSEPDSPFSPWVRRQAFLESASLDSSAQRAIDLARRIDS